jgi:hypothetical protein
MSDPPTFLASARRRIAAASIVAFGTFLGLATFNVVGVTAHAPPTGDPANANGTNPALVLPQGDFFGVPGLGGGAGPVAQPPIIPGGGQPMLSSGGS